MTSQDPCPLCGRTVGVAHTISVCRACHGSLQRSGTISLRSTAEFSVEQLVQDAADQATPVVPRSAEVTGSLCCSWCGRSAEQVKKILSHDNAHICNECVALCSEILAAERE